MTTGEATKGCRRGDPRQLLYMDDLVLTAEAREGVDLMFSNWKQAMEKRLRSEYREDQDNGD